MCKKILRFYAKKLYLSRLWFLQYTDMIHLSAQVELAELETLQVIVKSNWQHTSSDETMKPSQPEFYANTSLSSQVLCCKQYINMYLGEYSTKFWLSVK